MERAVKHLVYECIVLKLNIAKSCMTAHLNLICHLKLCLCILSLLRFGLSYVCIYGKVSRNVGVSHNQRSGEV